MKTITAQLNDHFQGNLTTLATCWKVTRRDGTVLGFTDHDVTLTIDGVPFVASSGFFRSAIANSATVSVDNLDVQGFLDDEIISESELRNGAYDFAEVEIFAVNWNDLSQGILRLRYGLFGEVTLRSSGLFTVELRGLMQWFSQTVGETISPDCRADLGDHRCRVELVPEVRRSGKRYSSGERVIVPTQFVRTSVHLPIENDRFDAYEVSSYFVWSLNNAVVTNFPQEPFDGNFYVRPTGPVGSIRRDIHYGSMPNTSQDLSWAWHVKHLEPGWEVGGIIEFLSVGGFLGVVINVLKTIEIPYMDASDLNGDINEWILQVGEFQDENVPPDNARMRVTIRWRPKHGQTEPAQIQIDTVGFYMSPLGIFDDDYMTFDQVPAVVTNGSIGWSSANSRTHPGNHNLMPSVGIGFLTHANWGATNQTVSIIDTGVDLSEVDEGNYRIRFFALAGSLEWGSSTLITLQFRDGSNNVIDTASKGEEPLRPYGEWHEREIDIPFPPNTRSITIILGAMLNEDRDDGSNPTTCYDFVSLDLHHVDGDSQTNILQYQQIEYEAQNRGVTASTMPAFTHTMNETVVDGEVTWRAVGPLFTHVGTVGSVVDNQQFTVPDIDAPDDWFKWGVLTFLDGANIARGVEVLSWNNSTKMMTLMLPVLQVIEPGNSIRVHAGCDKTRGSGGCGKFDNILNYRGEPEVPGTDHYFKVGGAS